MDHADAWLIKNDDKIHLENIKLSFTHENKQSALKHGEGKMHHQEQQMQETYYKKISKEILKYRNVLLFGPTNAKNELHNYLMDDHQFSNIKFNIINSDKLTEIEMKAFVAKHFH